MASVNGLYAYYIRNEVGNPLLPDEKHHISKVAPFSYISEVK